MTGQRRWVIGLATGTGLVVTLTSSLAVLAHYFVNELSQPHKVLDEALFSWEVPGFNKEPEQTSRRNILFKTVDGTLLCGEFWAQDHLRPTVVLCHGYRVSRAHLRTVAALEYAQGYNVFSFDFRGHGESDSVNTSGGNAEVHDLEAALVVAAKQPETLPGKIVIHGFSMGAAVALLMTPQPEVAAIIADSPYAHSDDILRRLIHHQLVQLSARRLPPWLHFTLPILAWSTVLMSGMVFRLRFGYELFAHPARSFKRWKAKAKAAEALLQPQPTPILLIHASGDQLIPLDHAVQIAAAAKAYKVPLETYFVDGSSHCGAYGHDPEQYVHAVHDFLAQALQDDFPLLAE